VTEEADRDRTGEVIGGRYRLDHLLGRGGQGYVFAATDLQDGEQVAVKTLSGPKAEDPEWRERMFREARAMVSLVGTSAVRVLDQKWSDKGELCLILERLHGRDFEDYLAERELKQQPFGLGELVDLLTPVARTLETAHEAGILHRDIKPSNIFIANQGNVRLLDFGFAKFISLRGLTRLGHVAGSPSYIAPEAWGGQPDKLDARVDVYGLAAVVFRALAGRPPFQAAKVYDLYRMVTEAKRPSLLEYRPDLPEDIDGWVEQSLAIDPNQRFSQIGALWTSISVLVTRASARPRPSTHRPASQALTSLPSPALAETELPGANDQPTVDLPSGDLVSAEESSPTAGASARQAKRPAAVAEPPRPKAPPERLDSKAAASGSPTSRPSAALGATAGGSERPLSNAPAADVAASTHSASEPVGSRPPASDRAGSKASASEPAHSESEPVFSLSASGSGSEPVFSLRVSKPKSESEASKAARSASEPPPSKPTRSDSPPAAASEPPAAAPRPRPPKPDAED
jgi:serine/threonine-protein kinase